MGNIIKFFVDYWVEVVGCIIIVFGATVGAIRFFSMPREKQIKQIKAWLLYAVIEAEKTFGGKVGQLKLVSVYDKFIERFPWFAKVLPFETFSAYVDDALVEMKDLLSSNTAMAAIVTTEKK